MISRTVSRFDWWLAGLCLSRAGSGMIFMTVAAALPVLQREWDMSAVAAGSITSGFNFGYAVSLVVFSSLADFWGSKPIFLWSNAAGAIFSLAFAAWGRDYHSALILYTLVGISLGGTYTTGLMLLASVYPVHKRGAASGYFIASTSLGYALSLGLCGLGLSSSGYVLAFWLTGGGPVVGCILAWVTLFRTNVPVVQRQTTQSFTREVLSNRPALLVITGYIFHNFELLGMWAWTPYFMGSCLAAVGVKLEAFGGGAYLSALFHITGLLASFSMGRLSDRLGRGSVMLTAALTSMVCSFVFGWMYGWSIYLVLGIGLIYAFSALGDSPVLSAALTEEVAGNYLGAAFGIRSLLGFGAGALAPLVFGAVLDWTNPAAVARQYTHWNWAFSVLGLGGLGAVICVGLYQRSRG